VDVLGRFFTTLAILIPSSGISLCSAAELRAPSPWKVIDSSLGESNVDHRREALVAIGTIESPDPEAIRRAENALSDKDARIRAAAALVLGQLKATSSISKLKSALLDKGEVAFAAARALTVLGDPSGRDILIAVLAGERKDTQPGMMTNAMRKAKEDLHHPQEVMMDGAGDAAGAMFGPAGAVVPAVKDAMDLKGKGVVGRAQAAAWLAKDPEPYAVTLLEWALADESHLVRIEAARGLGQRGNTESIAKLQPLLSEDNNLLRDMAAAAVIRIQERKGVSGTPADGVPEITANKH